ncbi:MAG: DUF998 domain-containing protein [Candidatus Bathyarchaeota archaeon]
MGQFLLLTLLAALLYPGGYDYFGYYFSDLGAVEARNGEPNLISRSLFFMALTIIALSLIPFWLIIHRLFRESTIERILSILGSVLGLLSSPFTIGVGLFPIDTQLETHFIVTLILVSLFALASLLYSIAITLNKNYPNYLGLMPFILLAISVASFATSLSDPSLGAFLQKIVAYGYFVWTLIPTYLLWSSKSSDSR